MLGDGVVGSFVVPGQGPVEWAYRDGAAMLGGRVQVPAPAAPYRLRTPAPPVAVLTDRSTASSGEAVAVAFRGLRNARSFGEATAGLSSANENYTLPDSAMILLTVALDADRTGTVYGGPLAPDEPVPGAPGADAPLAAALRWLAGRCPR